MNILWIEDKYSAIKYVMEMLEKKGHNVFWAFGINDANAYLSKERIDCLVVDLRMPPGGLIAKLARRTEDGELTGWIWLTEVVLKKFPELKERTIIFSAYINSLREKIQANEHVDIIKIGKTLDEGYAKLFEAIDRIENRPKTTK